MSAVAVQFDPTFAMGSRSAFTWPGPIESASPSSSILGADISSLVTASEASLTPPNDARSLAASPPRGTLTPEQQLKRQRDRTRRDSKLSARMRRADSASYTTSPPPMTMNDVSSAIPLPIYSTAPSSVTLLAGPNNPLGSQPYLSSYTSSLQGSPQPPQVFTSAPYQQSMQTTYNMPMDYSAIYGAPSEYSPRSQPIPVSQETTNLLYQVPTVPAAVPNSNGSQENSNVRVVQGRPKPRCWEHGCNGRQFSTFSNLLRHQREKSGQASKASCPNCGAEFTRTTARNGHLLHDKCKRRSS